MKRSALCAFVSLAAACGSSAPIFPLDAPPAPPADAPTVVTLKPGDDAKLAFINARTGQTIVFTQGTYMFSEPLTLSVPGVTVKGMGSRDGVILDFSTATGDGHGISVTAGDFILDGLTVRDTKDDAVRIQGTDPQHPIKNVTIRNVKVYFTAGSVPANPGYAIYPTTSENVLVENCDVSGASDAGLYVGQSKNIMVRNNLVHENVNGIEIENSTGAEVMGNVSMNNVGGILVFNLPGLPIKSGSLTVVHDNMVLSNNHDPFAPLSGSIGGLVPSGSGMIILASDQTEIRANTITGNNSTGIAVIACSTLAALSNPDYCNDPGYDIFPQGINIHDNVFSGNGTMPQRFFAVFQDSSMHLEDIVWDGVVDASKADPSGDDRLCVRQNGSATYLQVDVASAKR